MENFDTIEEAQNQLKILNANLSDSRILLTFGIVETFDNLTSKKVYQTGLILKEHEAIFNSQNTETKHLFIYATLLAINLIDLTDSVYSSPKVATNFNNLVAENNDFATIQKLISK